MSDSPEDRYRFTYSEFSPYANVELLVANHFRPGRLVVDLGCGSGALAERLRDTGFVYVGVDVDPSQLKDLDERGFETHELEVAATEEFDERIRRIVGNRSLGGFLLVDVIEHLTDANGVLQILRSLATEADAAPVVVCVPNVTHFDLGAKLLQGRWDETSTGILDRSHVKFYSASKLDSFMRSSGWCEIGKADFQFDESDQHFPVGNTALTNGTLLNSVLRIVREGAGEGADVVQWIRVYIPGPATCGPEDDVRLRDVDVPFLTVLTRTQGNRLDTLQEALLCLAAQDCTDYEALVLAHNVSPSQLDQIKSLVDALSPDVAERFRVLPVAGGGRVRPLNVGIEQSRGRYVAVLDDDDLVFAHWITVFKDLAQHFPGRLLRAVVAGQQVQRGDWPDRPGFHPTTGILTPYPSEFDLFDHFIDNRSPLCGLAFPRSIFAELGLTFDESLPVLEDWDLLLQSASFCGVASSPEYTSIYRHWTVGHNSSSIHTKSEWEGARRAVLAKLDQRASIFPPGSITKVRDLQLQVEGAIESLEATIKTLEAANDSMRVELYETHTKVEELLALHHDTNERLSAAYVELKRSYEESTSWKVTSPLRRALGLFSSRQRSTS